MNNLKLCLFSLIISLVLCADNCTVDLSMRFDCGYYGINSTQCHKRGCCYQKLSGYASCYYSIQSGTCQSIFFDGRNGPGFDDDFEYKMYMNFLKNLNVQGLGGVYVGNDNTDSTSFYDWMRDSSIAMRAFMEYNDWKYTAIQQKMKSYVGWVSRVQRLIDPHGYDIRINPKFELPNGSVYMGNVDRPQTDGVGVRAGNLIHYAQLLLDNNESYEAMTNVIPLIKFDLDWILDKWQTKGWDAFSTQQSTDIFWNRAGYVDALSLCTQLFTRVSDLVYARKCLTLKQTILNSLNNHWTGSYFYQVNGSKDSMVLQALSMFNVYSLTDDRIAKTIVVLSKLFCIMFRLNQVDHQPGILMGNVLGGTTNIRPQFTGILAKLLYQGANVALTQGFQAHQDKTAWSQLLNISQTSSNIEIAQAAINAGDSVLNRLYKYVKYDGGMIAQIIDKKTGSQMSTKNFTWSYANILTALRQRKKSVQTMNSFKTLRQQ